MPRCEKRLCESALLKKTKNKTSKTIQRVYFQTSSRELESRRGQAHKTQLVFTFATRQRHAALCADPNIPSLTVLTNKAGAFSSSYSSSFLFFSKREIHTSFQTWDMHFCSNIYPVSTLKVKICENKKKNEKKKKKKEDLNASVSADASEPFIK